MFIHNGYIWFAKPALVPSPLLAPLPGQGKIIPCTLQVTHRTSITQFKVRKFALITNHRNHNHNPSHIITVHHQDSLLPKIRQKRMY